MLEEKMLEKKVWAVVGANENAEKYGNMIYKKLKTFGYKVYPVNPKYQVIEGDKCYSNLSLLPEKPDVINMVVSPNIGKTVIEEAANLGVENIWLQPGTYNDEIINLIDKKGINAVKACVLMSLNK
ncbi:MAG TPA: CoA-binding protein [Clostridium sp.]|nr:CoA-binding protein [Clostridium sp.]